MESDVNKINSVAHTTSAASVNTREGELNGFKGLAAGQAGPML